MCQYTKRHMKVTKPKPTQKKVAVNLSIDPTLKQVGEKYFGATKYGSLSGFVEAKLNLEFAKGADLIRAIGMAVPQSAVVKK
jgi:hypothetical protein